MSQLSLLEILHRLIERTFGMHTGISHVGHFVLGDLGFERLYAGTRPLNRVDSGSWPGAAVLVRECRGELRVALYYPDSLISALERKNPLHGLDADNLLPFAVFVEELDHLLTLADRASERRPSSLFELELHAGVTKYMVTRHFLERTLGRTLLAAECTWLRSFLFETLTPGSVDPSVRQRYLDADRLSARFCRKLEDMPPSERLAEVRAFHPLAASAAVRRIESFSA